MVTTRKIIDTLGWDSLHILGANNPVSSIIEVGAWIKFGGYQTLGGGNQEDQDRQLP